LDWEGKPLIDLPPYEEIVGVLTLTEREYEILMRHAEMAKSE